MLLIVLVSCLVVERRCCPSYVVNIYKIKIKFVIAAANIKSDIVSVSSSKVQIDMKPFKAPVAWQRFEEIGFLSLYFMMVAIEGRDNDEDFWNDFVVRLAASGVYRDKEECSKQVMMWEMLEASYMQ